MDKINVLISYLVAICNFAKDIHYNCKGEAFYSKHLLADKICDGLDEHIDSIKEIFFMAADKIPLPNGEYLSRATSLIPVITSDDKKNFELMSNLLVSALEHIESITDLTRGESSLIDSVAQDLQQNLALVNFQIKE